MSDDASYRPPAPGEVILRGNPPKSFSWRCPDCKHAMSGGLGDVAVSGWDNPRWVLSGTAENPTLTPSLGCSYCFGPATGHFWLRDGELVRA